MMSKSSNHKELAPPQGELEAARLAQISLLELLLEPGGYTDGDGMREEMRDRLAELRGKE